MAEPLTVLVVGATGSIGRHVITTALDAGHHVRALIRGADRASQVDPRAEAVVGQLTDPSTLGDAVAGIDAVIFTHGDNSNPEAVNYGAVRNVLQALDGRRVRIALMTTVGVTVLRDSSTWKRRGERLVRASGNEYTIVRPGWFDYNAADQRRIVMLQGDRRQAGNPSDGVIARDQIARVLVDALTTPSAAGRAFELVAERGAEQQNLSDTFAALTPDSGITATGELDNLPVDAEPAEVRHDLDTAAMRRLIDRTFNETREGRVLPTE
jgi:uncharacterized protein YbjT (DUF2867 family)